MRHLCAGHFFAGLVFRGFQIIEKAASSKLHPCIETLNSRNLGFAKDSLKASFDRGPYVKDSLMASFDRGP